MKSREFNKLSLTDRRKILVEQTAVSPKEAAEICKKDTKVKDLPNELKTYFN